MFRSKSVELVNIDELTEHPENSKIFSISEKDKEGLLQSVRMHGVLVNILVNLRSDGTKRIVSGHGRRWAAKECGQTEIRAEYIQVDDATELLLLFACNVGRDLKEAYKVRFFKQVKQFLRQNKYFIGNSETYNDYDENIGAFVHVVDGLGVDVSKMRIWEIIEKITGFSKREQETLTRVCDLEYRAKVFDDLRELKKVKKKDIEYLESVWQNLEDEICEGMTTIAKVDKEVTALLKQIDNLKNPSKNEVKKVEKSKPEAPFKSEKATEVSAGIYANTYENAYNFLEGLSLRGARTGQLKGTWSWSLNEVATEMERWANLVLENQ